MTLTDEFKILDGKIKANQAQYDLDREVAKISASSSNELDKYEYLTGEDLIYKPGVVEPTKFEYSPLGKVFNKGLGKKDKKEKQLKMIEKKDSKQLDIKSVINIFDEELKNQRICSSNLMLMKKVLTTKGLALREIKIWNLILETRSL